MYDNNNRSGDTLSLKSTSTCSNLNIHSALAGNTETDNNSEKAVSSSTQDFTADLEHSKTLVIATDSEWDGRTKEWLSTQFFCKNTNQKLLFVTENCSDEVKLFLVSYCNLKQIQLEFCQMSDSLNLTKKVLEIVDHQGYYTNVKILIFYSPKDLEYALGWNLVEIAYKNESIVQKRNVRSNKPVIVHANDKEYKVNIKDLKGWTNQGLVDIARTVGIDMKNKHELDDYKSHMKDALEEIPQTFVDYAMDDVTDLAQIHELFIELIRWVQKDIIGIAEEDCFTSEDIPMTTGSLVATTFEKWLYSLAENKTLFKFAVRKLGLLDTSDKGYDSARKRLYALTKTHTRRETILDILATNNQTLIDPLERLLSGHTRFDYLAYSQAGVEYFATITEDSASFNALVQGGRCNNERATEYRVDYGADIDLKSCYGSALRAFTFPVGLPRVFGWTPNERRMTLREFLNRYHHKFAENLWTITVSGNLTFTQDLIYSKLTTQKQINKAILGDWEKEINDNDRDDDLSHIPADFGLIRKEIVNGIITTEVLEVISKVATSKEYKEIMDLQVVAACGYYEEDRVTDIEDWIDIVLADQGKLANYCGVHGNKRDTRTRKWFALPLENFIGKLVDVRNQYKKTEKPKSETLKLFINTLYGDLASPYFPIGNTVVANNITARARVGSWMLNKALHTRQSITDGGMYCLLAVPSLKPGGCKPGLTTLSTNTEWEYGHKNDKRFRKLQPLAGLDWKTIIETNGDELKQLDELAIQHIKNFWDIYELELPFAIEHKLDNTFTVAAYFNKAHYLLRTINGQDLYKIRGCKNYETESGYKKHPTYQLLWNILEGIDDFPESTEYTHTSLLKIGKWVDAQKSKAYETIKQQNLRPGDEVVEVRQARYNNTHIPCDTVAEFKRRRQRKTVDHGQDVLWFERYAREGIAKLHTLMLNDTLRD